MKFPVAGSEHDVFSPEYKESKSMKLTKITLITAALLATSVAFAAPKSFKKADANGDGSIDASEFAEAGVKDREFAKLDKDGDGSLSNKEYSVVLDESCE
jgi:hypothetical protein